MIKTQFSSISTSLLGWPTDAFKIDVVDPSPVHTVLIFIPGNPGLIEWYQTFFEQILQELGPGFACRGVANAGHSLCIDKVDVAANEERLGKSKAIPWTVDGQSLHKCSFVDQIIQEFEGNKRQKIGFIFVSHSIGCHFVQRMCILRPDILMRACRFIFLMPFIRMQAPRRKAIVLDTAAAAPNAVIHAHESLMYGLASLPLSAVDALLVNTMNDAKGRHVAAKLLQLPAFARNFFTLGCEEIRDVPEQFDVCSLRLIGKQCPLHMLFAGNDHWSPSFHMDDLCTLNQQKVIPSNVVQLDYRPELKHDFVSDINQIPKVVQFCLEVIRTGKTRYASGEPTLPLSRL